MSDVPRRRCAWTQSSLLTIRFVMVLNPILALKPLVFDRFVREHVDADGLLHEHVTYVLLVRKYVRERRDGPPFAPHRRRYPLFVQYPPHMGQVSGLYEFTVYLPYNICFAVRTAFMGRELIAFSLKPVCVY